MTILYPAFLLVFMDLKEKTDFFVVDLDNLNAPLDWSLVFGNHNPVRLEIGSGKGEFISGIAPRLTQVNFFGIELKGRRVETCLKKMEPSTHANVRMGRLFVDRFVTKIIPAGSVERIYIQHPDPWPKRSHHKHRLIQHEFLDVLYTLLIPNGQLRIITDHVEYGQWIEAKFRQRLDFSPIHVGGFNPDVCDDHVVTHYERKFRALGDEPKFLFYKREEK